jgi:hypothetical protein
MVVFPRLDDAAQLDELRRDGRGDLDDRFVPGGGAFLRQVADVHVALGDDLAVVRELLAEDDGKERGLARAIRPDEADAVFAIQLQRDVGEQGSSAVGFGDA